MSVTHVLLVAVIPFLVAFYRYSRHGLVPRALYQWLVGAVAALIVVAIEGWIL